MSIDDTSNRRALISRRTFGGLGVVAGAAAAVASLPGAAGAATATSSLLSTAQPQALGPADPSLTYLSLDAFAFFTDSTIDAQGRIYQDATGVQPSVVNTRLSAALPIPVGSTIHQLNVAYQQQPIMEIWKRSMVTPMPYAPVFQQSVPLADPGPATTTLEFDPPIPVDQGETVAVRFFATAGSSVLGVTVGYRPPLQAFVPFTGGTPRVLDTRLTGGKLNDGEERTVSLGFAGARSAVINLTITETEGNGGFVAVFPADIAWPGNSSINWTTAGQNIANGVITGVDALGRIKIHVGAARTQVVIDRIGFFV